MPQNTRKNTKILKKTSNMDDKIEILENQLQLYMNKFCDLVSKSINIDSEKEDVSQIANDLRESYGKMVEIVNGMKFLDDTQEFLSINVKTFQKKNNTGIGHLGVLDSHIEKIGQDVEFGLSSISDLK